MLPVTFLPPAKQFLKKIRDKRLKKKYEQAITEIRKNSDVGRFKTGDLTGIRGYDIKHEGIYYEIAYCFGQCTR